VSLALKEVARAPMGAMDGYDISLDFLRIFAASPD
jgi:hypothetical protein